MFSGPPEYHVLEFTRLEGDDFRKRETLKEIVLPIPSGATDFKLEGGR